MPLNPPRERKKMAEAVYLPKLGMTMEEGTLVRWLVPDGAHVKRGEPIFELETEKVELEVEAEAEGVLRHLIAEDTTLKPGDVVGALLATGEALPQVLVQRVAAQSGQETVPSAASSTPSENPAELTERAAGEDRLRVTPVARRLAQENEIDVTELKGSGPDGRVVERDVLVAIEAAKTQAAVTKTVPAEPPMLRASPIARRLAAEHGIDLASIGGPGPEGRIVEADVDRAIDAAASGVATPEPLPGLRYSGRRRTIGERMLKSVQSMAQVTLVSEVPIGDAQRMLHGLNREWRGDGVVVTLTALLVRACGIALRELPRFNSRLEGDQIAVAPDVNVGVAVNVEEGLIVPVVRRADSSSLKDVAKSVRELTERARNGGLRLDDVAGGSFTITSLETTGVDAFTPIINPPQAAILGVGRMRDVAAFEGERVVKAQASTLSLTFDHRVADGAEAARFLDRIAELLGRPYLLM